MEWSNESTSNVQLIEVEVFTFLLVSQNIAFITFLENEMRLRKYAVFELNVNCNVISFNIMVVISRKYLFELYSCTGSTLKNLIIYSSKF